MARQRGGFIDMRQNWSQRNQRSEMTFKDQHGRKWYGAIELKTGDTTGLIQPQFTAPIVPDQKYLERVPERPYDLFINYKRWEEDIRQARTEWEREGRQLGRKMHGDAFDPHKAFTADVLDIIGEPPEAIEPVIAARQGNTWVLGLTNRVDIKLVKFIDVDRLDPEVRRKNEPDFSEVTTEDEDEVRDRRGHTERQDAGGRENIGPGKPRVRGAGKGKGAGKNKPTDRPRYPRGHPKAGTFIPAKELA